MTLGHASMALETAFSFIWIGTFSYWPQVFLNPILPPSYLKCTKQRAKKDGAYTIFYMGVNAGAFFGMMLCGVFGENFGWSWGFGLAGIFMFLGMLQFLLAKNLFGSIGAQPSKIVEVELPQNITEKSAMPRESAKMT